MPHILAGRKFFVHASIFFDRDAYASFGMHVFAVLVILLFGSGTVFLRVLGKVVQFCLCILYLCIQCDEFCDAGLFAVYECFPVRTVYNLSRAVAVAILP